MTAKEKRRDGALDVPPLVNHKPSGSGNGCGNSYDNILNETAVFGLAGGGDPALESRVRVLSCISYKKYTRKKANGLSSAPSPELSAATSIWGILRCVQNDSVIRFLSLRLLLRKSHLQVAIINRSPLWLRTIPRIVRLTRRALVRGRLFFA